MNTTATCCARQRFIHTCTHTPWMCTCHTSVSSPVALPLQLLRRGRQTRMCTARCKWHRMAPSRSTQETPPPSSLLLLLLLLKLLIIHVLNSENHVRNVNTPRPCLFDTIKIRVFTGKGWHLLRINGERQMRGQRAREHLPTAHVQQGPLDLRSLPLTKIVLLNCHKPGFAIGFG